MTIKPLADRVLVQPKAAEEVTASGIIIPDTAKEKPMRGIVIAVGCGTKRRRNGSQGRRRSPLWQICRHRA